MEKAKGDPTEINKIMMGIDRVVNGKHSKLFHKAEVSNLRAQD